MKKAITSILAALLFCAMFAGCANSVKESEGTETRLSLPIAMHISDQETADEIYGILRDAGLPGADVFRKWVLDFAETVGEDAKLTDEWSTIDELKPDVFACMDGWESRYDYSDANCRITAFLLLGDLIRVDSPEENYEGTYLMFDLDAIENTEKYAFLRGKEAAFTTLFGDKPVSREKVGQQLYSEMWEKEYLISVNSDRASLISVVMYDPAFEVLFVGHTGVLVDCGDYMLFIEKIAFEQPYQATKVSSIDELLDMFSARPEYFGDEGSIGPYVYQNGVFIAELEASRTMD